MTISIIKSDNNTLVVDSRLIAQELGIKHDNFMQTIDTHSEAIQVHFGVILFETGKPQGGVKGGRPDKYCLLTEDQFIFIATLSRNTTKVVHVKASIVAAFSQARKALACCTPKKWEAKSFAASTIINDSKPFLLELIDSMNDKVDLRRANSALTELHSLINTRDALMEQVKTVNETLRRDFTAKKTGVVTHD